jgi:hypothetical protein
MVNQPFCNMTDGLYGDGGLLAVAVRADSGRGEVMFAA